ncbi:leucyl aminopeptidase [Limnothrix sp. FACHB-1083]|uniref:leucyl aminopeptidase n=1 Tax=Limnothrix sp. FACHB-1083 TaxID=2692815 RepID=UPI0016806F5F|nr:leucyl aminopeptidase [Limnothrix sp. FACHB-1083]MBD2159261.1 leucyl aminopeptidase [Limnothrix sp. FACHB-1083]
MEFRASVSSPIEWTGAGLAIGLFESELETLAGDLAALNDRLGGALREAIDEAEFKGKPGNTATLRVGSSTPVRKLILIGLGNSEDLPLDRLRQGAAAAAKAARAQKCDRLAMAFPLANQEAAAAAQAITEGVHLSLYRDRRFKSDSEENGKTPKPETIELLPFRNGTTDSAAIAQGIDRGEKIAAGTILARELVAAPANVVTPITMAETAQAIAANPGWELTILEKEDCEKLGMGSFLGVAQASDLPPKFIHLVYKPQGTPRKKLAIVGKGLTFDSGGLNIKAGVGSSIEMMKTDMGGAGATFGAAQAIALLQPDVEVHFISAVTENMISGRAMHPGDILTASNGKTIEVGNTDAEGRLTLADALVYADKLGVEAIVDLATLTGACVVALGDEIAGLWATDETLANGLKAAAAKAGEKLWQMPLEEPYFDKMKSVVADMKNIGGRAGGSITAALFLKQFVKDTPWAHLDVAGPVWSDKDSGLNPAGATGYGVRTLVEWILA